MRFVDISQRQTRSLDIIDLYVSITLNRRSSPFDNMHILVTGAAGLIGSHSMRSLLEQGHTVTATDIAPLPQALLDSLSQYPLEQITADLTSIPAVDAIFDAADPPFDAVVHVGGVRSPVGMDPRLVHNINVTATYNVLYTAVSRGVRRLVQASSCNALGLSWTKPEHWHLDYVPVDEKHPKRPVSPSGDSACCLVCWRKRAGVLTKFALTLPLGRRLQSLQAVSAEPRP
jgi:nucleoside-diphosphate-sugar epimerase